MPSPSIIGTSLGLTSALAWSLANLAIQKSTRRFGPFGALLGAQVAGGGVTLAIGLAWNGVPHAPSGAVIVAVLAAGLAAAIAYGGLFDALERGAAAVCAPIISAWSVVSVAIDVAFFERKIGPFAWMGIACVVIGNGMLARFGAHETPGQTKTPRRAILTAALSAVGFGVMVPATARVSEWAGSINAVPIVWAAQWLVGWPIGLVFGLRLFTTRPATKGDFGTLALPGFFEAVGFLALTIGMTHAPIAIVAPASSLSTALTVLWGVWLLGERLSRPALAGAVIAAIGVVVVNL